MSTIYIIPTPIGNLGDITYRAIDVLKKSDKIFAEDTRISKKLLLHYGVKQRLYPYHQHNEHFVVDKIIEDLLEDEQFISLVSDAGTPLLSDPGFKLIRYLIDNHVNVVPLPGPTSITTGLIASGLPTDKFQFLGFFPKTAKDKVSFYSELNRKNITSIFFESSHRIETTLEDIFLNYPNGKIHY